MYATANELFVELRRAAKDYPAKREQLRQIAAIAEQHGLEAGIAAFTNWQQKQALNAPLKNGGFLPLPANPQQEQLWTLPNTATTENPDNPDDASRLKNWLLNYCNRRKVDRVAYHAIRKCGPVKDQGQLQSAFDHLEHQGITWKEKRGRQIFARVNPNFLQHKRPRKTTLFLETESDAQNATCPPEKKHVFFHDKEVTGLALMVKNDGTRIYLFEKSVKGRTKRLTLGDAAHWTLEDARAQARKLTVLACQGVDLQTVKSSVKPSAAPTLPKPDDALTAINNHQPDSNPPVTTLPQAEVEKAVYRVLEACFRQMAEFFKNKVTHV